MVIHLGGALPPPSRSLPWQSKRLKTKHAQTNVLIASTWPCSQWGLPCHFCCQKRGVLLPHHFTLTPLKGRFIFCGAFPKVSLAGGYPALCFRGARTFLYPKFYLKIATTQTACKVLSHCAICMKKSKQKRGTLGFRCLRHQLYRNKSGIFIPRNKQKKGFPFFIF